MATGLITALDTLDLATAEGWAAAVAPHCGMLKLGLEFYLAQGAAGVRRINHLPIFLDLKLHDIPNTVAGAISAILPLRPAMVTLHAAGGGLMIAAARQAAEVAGSRRPLLLGVTVLTSLDAETLVATGIAGGTRQQSLRMGRLSMKSGADGVVCSAHEVAALRDALGPDAILVVPGIRPDGHDRGDQTRTMTPRSAAAGGADWIVVGRPITRADDPKAAAAKVAGELLG